MSGNIHAIGAETENQRVGAKLVLAHATSPWCLQQIFPVKWDFEELGKGRGSGFTRTWAS